MRREVKVYNLDMVLAVGYRSTFPRALQFRQWATSVLREYLVKGFAMDDDTLKAADGWDYFSTSGWSGFAPCVPRRSAIRRSGAPTRRITRGDGSP